MVEGGGFVDMDGKTARLVRKDQPFRLFRMRPCLIGFRRLGLFQNIDCHTLALRLRQQRLCVAFDRDSGDSVRRRRSPALLLWLESSVSAGGVMRQGTATIMRTSPARGACVGCAVLLPVCFFEGASKMHGLSSRNKC